MQTYLKTRPVWIQMLIFLSLAFGIVLIFGFIGGAIIANRAGVDLVEIGNSKNWDLDDPKTVFVIRGLVLLQFLGLFLIPSFLFAYFSDPKPAAYLGLKKPWKPAYWLLAVAALVLSIPLVEFSGLLNHELAVSQGSRQWVEEMEQEAMRTLQLMLGQKGISQLLINLVFIAVFAGIGEELFFRGIIQRLLIRSFKSPWGGIIITAFIFSFFHFQFYGFLPRFFLGILLGAIYWYSGSLWPAILAHFAYDALFIIIAYNQPSLVSNPEAAVLTKNMMTLGIMALASTCIVVLIVLQMKKMSRTYFNEIYADDFKQPTFPGF